MGRHHLMNNFAENPYMRYFTADGELVKVRTPRSEYLAKVNRRLHVGWHWLPDEVQPPSPVVFGGSYGGDDIIPRHGLTLSRMADWATLKH